MSDPKRARASTPRSRSGCANCRKRKLKCDEARPECQRCRHSGWQCPGYTQNTLHQRTKDALTQPKVVEIGTRQPTLAHLHVSQYALPFKVPGSRDERQALHYFSTFTAADISDPSSHDFWSYIILQRCTHEAPLRHAAAALGQLHVEYIATPKTCDFAPSLDAIKGYGKAIKSLRIYLDNHQTPSRSMVLMCSAVFFCFELIRGEQGAALRHLESGLQMLKYWQESDSATFDDNAGENRQLLAIFAHMDLEATVFDQDRLPILRLRAEDIADTTSCKGLPRTTLKELHQSVFMLSHAAIVFLVESVPYRLVDVGYIPEPIVDRRRQLLDSIANWELRADRSFQETVNSSMDSPVLQRYQKTIAMGKLHYGMMRLLLLHSLNDCIKATSPSFDDEAERLLDAAEIIKSPPDLDTDQPSRRFSLHVGIVQPVFLLALKVRDSYLRDRALRMLEEAQGRREGFHDAHMMAEAITTLASRAEYMELNDERTALEYVLERLQVV